MLLKLKPPISFACTQLSSIISLAIIFLLFGMLFGKATAQDKTNRIGAPTFPGSGVGAIPDGGPDCGNPGQPLDITFEVEGVSSAIATSISLDMSHTWVGDLRMTLIAPSGESHVVFAETKETSTECGDNSDLEGTYQFRDHLNTNLCDFFDKDTIPAGIYRTSDLCVNTSLDETFFDSEPNGTWTLRITDSGAGDTGFISAASLSFLFIVDDFTPRNVDFEGDRISDWVVARPVIPSGQNFSEIDKKEVSTSPQPESTPIPYYWYINRSADSNLEIRQFGHSDTDTFVPTHFDGDFVTDYAVWRKNVFEGTGSFLVLESSTGTVREEEFGLLGDNPKAVADYDGDGNVDLATFRCPDTPGQCFFFYRASSDNPNSDITFVPWGFGTDLTPCPGDYDGDARADFCVRRENPNAPGHAQFAILQSGTGEVEFIDWGLLTDTIVPGNFSGDITDDLAVVRDNGGQLTWYILERGGGAKVFEWGISGDKITPGDYDGDVYTDISIWRPEESNSTFYVLRSSDHSLLTFRWGSHTDIPLAGWQVQ